MVRRRQVENPDFQAYMEGNEEQRDAEASRRHDDFDRRMANVSTRGFITERGITTEGMEPTTIPGTIHQRGWARYTQTPTSYHPILVREFYAAMKPEVFQERGLVWVRHVPVRLTADLINNYFQTPVDEEWNLSIDGIPVEHIFTHDVDGLVADLRRDHQVVREAPPTIVSHGALSPDLAFWSVFLKHNLTPSTHRTFVNLETAKLLYSINNGLGLDIGTILLAQILKAGSNTRCLLPFPCLITHFCQSAGVYISPDGSELVRPMGNLCKKAYNHFCSSHGLPNILQERRYRNRGRNAQEQEQAQAQGQPEAPAARARQPPRQHIPEQLAPWAARITENVDAIRAGQDAQRTVLDEVVVEQRRTNQIAEGVRHELDRRFFTNTFRRGFRNYVFGSSSGQPPNDGN